MHRASPTLLVLATCLAASLMSAAPVSAEESPSAEPTAQPTAQATPSPIAEPSPAPSSAPSPTSREGDTLVSVHVAMPASVDTARTAAPALAPRTRLPLRRGDIGSKVATLQQRLAWLGYDISVGNTETQTFGRSTRAAVRKFQAKNWLTGSGRVTKRTWGLLRRQAEPLGILPRRCTEVRKSLCIDKTTRTLRLVIKGEVELVTDARFGAPGMETGEGLFTVHEKSFNHVSSRFHSWMPRAMFFNGDEAVHYSPDFAAVGYLRGSHGCVGIRDMEVASTLFEKVPVGTRVYVYWS